LRLRDLIFSLLLSAPCCAEPLSIQTQSGPVVLDVELATDGPSRALGLMFREKLCEKCGMLFVFPQVQKVSLWMKNTHIPLDMIFIDGHGKIVHIHPNAEPRSLKEIPSPVPAKAVIEIGGGQASRLGIRQGDRVQHSLFSGQ
jgi:uncharacterized protein